MTLTVADPVSPWLSVAVSVSTCETADGSKAATVRGAEDDTFRYLLMPVRVS